MNSDTAYYWPARERELLNETSQTAVAVVAAAAAAVAAAAAAAVAALPLPALVSSMTDL
jgi:hypothetical protein